MFDMSRPERLAYRYQGEPVKREVLYFLAHALTDLTQFGHSYKGKDEDGY